MNDELVRRLREKAGAFDYDGKPDIACDYEQASDVIETLSRRETPMKITEVHVDKYYCPACGQRLLPEPQKEK